MVKSVVGRTVVVEGEVSGDGDLTVLGAIVGQVQLQADLTVAMGARVEATLWAHNVEVSGAVVGNIEAQDKVEITASGRVLGDVRAPRILIANGAELKGNVSLDG